jgi:hypothetical protein
MRYEDQNNLLSKFPKIELSYEKRIHKNVHQNNFAISIPKGLKYFAWFKNYKGKNFCFFLKLFKRNRISEITIKRCCFKNDLCLGKGTILYGTIFFHKSQFFNVEDIYFFKGKNISRCNQKKKLHFIAELFKKYIKQVAILKNDIIFGLPIYSKNENDFLKIPYELYCIQYRDLENCRPFLNKTLNFERREIFLAKPKIQPDIYKLFTMKNEKLIFFDYAYIRDYTTSVFMNSLFRNIKENINLDTLEESDDEDEFQNIKNDKYVYLDKSFKILCVYNNRFKKWKPIELAPDKSKISSL